MALQTLTTTVAHDATGIATGTATATNTNVSSDTNANSSLFGTNGPTPLIPAFLLTGLLLVGIVLMMWYKRVGYRGRAAPSNGAIGAGVDEFFRRAKLAKPEPIPHLWDVYLRLSRRTGKESGYARWREMNPLSASLVDPENASTYKAPDSVGSDPTHDPAPRHTPRWRMFNRKTIPITPEHLDTNACTPQSRMRVSVLIAMPAPSRYPRISDCAVGKGMASASSDDHEKSDKWDFNFMLGISEVPYERERS